ncbi:hypothetical protein JCM11641_004406 [Rhodosporidiobolus odoratus]
MGAGEATDAYDEFVGKREKDSSEIEREAAEEGKMVSAISTALRPTSPQISRPPRKHASVVRGELKPGALTTRGIVAAAAHIAEHVKEFQMFAPKADSDIGEDFFEVFPNLEQAVLIGAGIEIRAGSEYLSAPSSATLPNLTSLSFYASLVDSHILDRLLSPNLTPQLRAVYLGDMSNESNDPYLPFLTNETLARLDMVSFNLNDSDFFDLQLLQGNVTDTPIVLSTFLHHFSRTDSSIFDEINPKHLHSVALRSTDLEAQSKPSCVADYPRNLSVLEAFVSRSNNLVSLTLPSFFHPDLPIPHELKGDRTTLLKVCQQEGVEVLWESGPATKGFQLSRRFWRYAKRLKAQQQAGKGGD